MIVFNSFNAARFTTPEGDDTVEESKGALQEDAERDVIVSCKVTKLHLLVCDMNDLYDKSHYVSDHKLKVRHDFDLNVGSRLALDVVHAQLPAARRGSSA